MTVLRMTSHQTLTGFHHLGFSSSNMQTLDKRISASSDQLDCIRGEFGLKCDFVLNIPRWWTLDHPYLIEESGSVTRNI